jgi:hypothetical protein
MLEITHNFMVILSKIRQKFIFRIVKTDKMWYDFSKVVICLQHNRKTISCFLMIFCIVMSCICFDNLKAEDLVRLSGAAAESGQLSPAGCGNVNEDICTTDMLGNTQPYILNQHTVVRNAKMQRKNVTLLWFQPVVALLRCPFKFFAYPALTNKWNTNAAEIIRFIHNEDGKKRI